MKDYVIAEWTMWLAGDMLQRGISVFSAPESDTLARLSHEFDRKTQLQVQDSLPGMSNNVKWKWTVAHSVASCWMLVTS